MWPEVVRTSLHSKPVIVLIGTAALAGIVTLLALRGSHPSAAIYQVSQRGRVFSIASIDIQKGDIIRIVNDDYNLRHHAYVRDDRFKFDSGDQEPGSITDIAFTASGDFNILCGIHPKMKLTVHVR